MSVCRREVEASHGVTLEINLYKDGSFVAEHTSVVSRVDQDRLRRDERHRAPVGILDEHLTLYQKTHVGMHTQRGTYGRTQVGRPAIARGIHDPLDATIARLDDVLMDPTDTAMDRSLQRRDARI